MSTWQRRAHGSRLDTRGLLLQCWPEAGEWKWQVRGMARPSSKVPPFDDLGIEETLEAAEQAAVRAARLYLEAELVALMEAA